VIKQRLITLYIFTLKKWRQIKNHLNTKQQIIDYVLKISYKMQHTNTIIGNNYVNYFRNLSQT